MAQHYIRRRRYQARVEQYKRSQEAADEARPPGEEKTADVVFEGGLHIPGDLHARLFDYQKTGAALLRCLSYSSVRWRILSIGDAYALRKGSADVVAAVDRCQVAVGAPHAACRGHHRR